jgi:hypothetical protein
MTNKEIEKKLEKVRKINAMSTNPKKEAAMILAKELGVSTRDANIEGRPAGIGIIIDRIYRYLQTQMMLNACISAKRSCKWAAIAAGIAAIGVIASWYIFLFKLLWQIFNGI